MASITLTDPVAGTVVSAGLHANNNSALRTAVNGGLDTANWAAGKIFAPSKLMQEAATTGQAIVWNGTTWVPTTISTAGYAITLPGSPTDGQQAILVDSITLPTYQWLFRWNAGSSNADKWECVGGAPAEAEVATAETTASTTYVDLATAGPSITVPRAGVYIITFGCEIDKTVSAVTTVHRVAAKLGAAAAADAESIVVTSANSTTQPTTVASPPIRRTLAASDVVKLQYKTSADTARHTRRGLTILPVRVS